MTCSSAVATGSTPRSATACRSAHGSSTRRGLVSGRRSMGATTGSASSAHSRRGNARAGRARPRSARSIGDLGHRSRGPRDAMGGGKSKRMVAALDIPAIETVSDRMAHRQPEPSDSQAGGVRLTATRSGACRAARRGRGCGQRGRRQRRARACIYPPFDLRFDRAARKRRGTDDVPREGGCRRDNRGRTAEEPDSPRGGHVLALRDGFPRYGARGAGTVPAPPARGRFPITTPAA